MVPESIPKTFIFDLDGTLAPTRELMGEENANALCGLLRKGAVIAVVSGSDLSQFMDRFIYRLPCIREFPHKIFLLPTSGARMYDWDGEKPVLLYEEKLSAEQKKKIIDALEVVIAQRPQWFPEKTYGPRIQDRETQISLAGLGRDAPRPLKEEWDPSHAKREVLVLELPQELKDEFTVAIGGTTTIDITKKGIDKAFGIEKFLSHTGIQVHEAVFIGDGIFPGGNDYEVLKSGVNTIPVTMHTQIPQKLAEFLT